MYGAQAIIRSPHQQLSFENDVEMYGAQAIFDSRAYNTWFENDVEMYGAQAYRYILELLRRLRMM